MGGQMDFVLICVHIKPSEAASEIGGLPAVYDNATATYAGVDNMVILGDFNADCSYLSAAAMANLTLRTDTRFHWLIADGTDTTVASSSCTYDRIVSSQQFADLVVGRQGKAFDFMTAFSLTQEQAKAVSDHFPVEVSLSVPFALAGGKFCADTVFGRASYASVAEGLAVDPTCAPGSIPPSASLRRLCADEAWGPAVASDCQLAVFLNEVGACHNTWHCDATYFTLFNHIQLMSHQFNPSQTPV